MSEAGAEMHEIIRTRISVNARRFGQNAQASGHPSETDGGKEDAGDEEEEEEEEEEERCAGGKRSSGDGGGTGTTRAAPQARSRHSSDSSHPGKHPATALAHSPPLPQSEDRASPDFPCRWRFRSPSSQTPSPPPRAAKRAHTDDDSPPLLIPDIKRPCVYLHEGTQTDDADLKLSAMPQDLQQQVQGILAVQRQESMRASLLSAAYRSLESARNLETKQLDTARATIDDLKLQLHQKSDEIKVAMVTHAKLREELEHQVQAATAERKELGAKIASTLSDLRQASAAKEALQAELGKTTKLAKEQTEAFAALRATVAEKEAQLQAALATRVAPNTTASEPSENESTPGSGAAAAKDAHAEAERILHNRVRDLEKEVESLQKKNKIMQTMLRVEKQRADEALAEIGELLGGSPRDSTHTETAAQQPPC
jgi:DNA repair exonuclease SbcCD ATPase subunit